MVPGHGGVLPASGDRWSCAVVVVPAGIRGVFRAGLVSIEEDVVDQSGVVRVARVVLRAVLVAVVVALVLAAGVLLLLALLAPPVFAFGATECPAGVCQVVPPVPDPPVDPGCGTEPGPPCGTPVPPPAPNPPGDPPATDPPTDPPEPPATDPPATKSPIAEPPPDGLPGGGGGPPRNVHARPGLTDGAGEMPGAVPPAGARLPVTGPSAGVAALVGVGLVLGGLVLLMVAGHRPAGRHRRVRRAACGE